VAISLTRFVSMHALQTRTGDGKDLVVLSGYVELVFVGPSTSDPNNWNRDELVGQVGPQWRSLYVVIVPIVSLTSIENEDVATNAGWAVDHCPAGLYNVFPGGPSGFQIELRPKLAVRDVDGQIRRLNYYVTALGELIPQ
jgi:hypothetical protein